MSRLNPGRIFPPTGPFLYTPSTLYKTPGDAVMRIMLSRAAVPNVISESNHAPPPPGHHRSRPQDVSREFRRARNNNIHTRQGKARYLTAADLKLSPNSCKEPNFGLEVSDVVYEALRTARTSSFVVLDSNKLKKKKNRAREIYRISCAKVDTFAGGEGGGHFQDRA